MLLKNLLKNIAHKLNERKIDYMIIGGQAVLIYGEPRLTKDIDITLGVDIDQLDNIISIVNELNLKVLVKNPRDFTKKTMVLPAIDEQTGLRVDFIFSFTEYEREALKRVNKIKIDEVEVNYISIEDLIIHKLISGRSRDLEDIQIILSKNHKIDENYLYKWLQIFSQTLDMDLIKIYQELKKMK